MKDQWLPAYDAQDPLQCKCLKILLHIWIGQGLFKGQGMAPELVKEVLLVPENKKKDC